MIKQKINLTTILIVCLIISVAASAIFMAKLIGAKLEFPKKQQKIITDNSQVSTPEPVIDNSIKFDVEKAKVGDKIGDMTITKLRGYKSERATADSAFVDFTGRVTITGDVIYNGSQRGEVVCMQNLDYGSQSKMPKMTSQFYVNVSFCFTDLGLAKKLLVKNMDQENQGQAKVIVDNYKIQWFPTEIYNTADLVSVVTP